MAEPLTPTWIQPSHPSIQKVLTSNAADFTTKSISLIDLPPYGLFAKFDFPPCTLASKPTYATLQIGKNEHMNLNSDLVYINHSCNPSVIFDTSSKSILAGPNGLKQGEELTFFYPSTEWDMAQGFKCFCGASTCRGWISGAKNMHPEQLSGIWLNAHIRALLEERDAAQLKDRTAGLQEEREDECWMTIESDRPLDGAVIGGPRYMGGGIAEIMGSMDNAEPRGDATEEALKSALEQARKVVDAAQKALDTYKSIHGRSDDDTGFGVVGARRQNGVGSRELSGEMGGDTWVD